MIKVYFQSLFAVISDLLTGVFYIGIFMLHCVVIAMIPMGIYRFFTDQWPWNDSTTLGLITTILAVSFGFFSGVLMPTEIEYRRKTMHQNSRNH